MKLIIAGGRDIEPSFGFMDGTIRLLRPYEHGPIQEIVSGGAQGVDTEGEHWAHHQEVPIQRFTADWEAHGKAAGPVRNKQMAEYADALLLIWDGQSKGSANMRKEMLKLNKPIYEVILTSPNTDRESLGESYVVA